MPLTLTFCDSWDHYNVISNKWDSSGSDCSIDLTGTKSRTGIGCLLINSAAFGPVKAIDQTTTPVVGTAYFSNANTPGPAQDVIRFEDVNTNSQQVRIGVNADGSIIVRRGNDPVSVTLGTSAAGVYLFNTYNYIEAQVRIANSPNGVVVVRVNGAEVLNITGVSTVFTAGGAGVFANAIRLMGAGGIQDLRHDDTYIGDWASDPTDPFYGAIRIYAETPFQDASPLQWTPSTGTVHFSLVDEIPPNGDTDYVSDDVIGQIDQYDYNTTGVPAVSQILAVQHVLDAKLDAAGSQSITSVVEGITNVDSVALTTTYHMATFPYDLNPATGVAWEGADFPASFGPAVAA